MKRVQIKLVMIDLLLVMVLMGFMGLPAWGAPLVADLEDGQQLLQEAIQLTEQTNYSGKVSYTYPLENGHHLESTYLVRQQKVAGEMRRRFDLLFPDFGGDYAVFIGSERIVYGDMIQYNSPSNRIDQYYYSLSPKDWQMVAPYRLMQEEVHYNNGRASRLPNLDLTDYWGKYRFRIDPMVQEFNGLGKMQLIGMYPEDSEIATGRFWVSIETGMLVRYELKLSRHRQISYELKDLKLVSADDELFTAFEGKVSFQRIPDLQQNPLELDVQPFIDQVDLPFLGGFFSDGMWGERLILLFGNGKDYQGIVLATGRVVPFNSDRREAVDLGAGVVAKVGERGGVVNAMFTLDGVEVGVDSNGSRSETMALCQKIVEGVQLPPTQLVKHFPALDQPAQNYHYRDAYSIAELAEQVPFELKVPSFTGWNLDEEKQAMMYQLSIKERFFESVNLTYQHNDDDLELELIISLDEQQLYGSHSQIKYFTDRGVQFGVSSWIFKHYGAEAAREYEGVKWQVGDLHYQLIINQKGLGIQDLALDCRNQLGELKVDPKRISRPRQEERYTFRGYYAELAPHFTQRVFDPERIGDFEQSNVVEFSEYNQQIVAFSYQKDGQWVRLEQYQYYADWPKRNKYQLGGVFVYENSHSRDGVPEIFFINWAIEGYNFVVQGADVDLLREFILEINQMIVNE